MRTTDSNNVPRISERDFDEALELFLDSGYRVKVVMNDHLFLYPDNKWARLGWKPLPLYRKVLYLLVLDYVEQIKG